MACLICGSQMGHLPDDQITRVDGGFVCASHAHDAAVAKLQKKADSAQTKADNAQDDADDSNKQDKPAAQAKADSAQQKADVAQEKADTAKTVVP